MAFKKAVKEQAKLRMAFAALPGRGKTYSSLAIACALGELIRKSGHGEGRVAVVDSERGSASLYADRFDFDVCELSDTFSPLAYVEKIQEAERSGYDIIICDSISHAWAGKGGALDQKDQAAARSSSGNSWTAWRDITPKHNALVDAMVGSKSHVIATMRQKMEYAQESEGGKTKIRQVGLAAVQREGMEYEFTLVGDLDENHTLRITKTRLDGVVALGELIERPGADFARRIWGWLMSGAAPAPRPPAPLAADANDRSSRRDVGPVAQAVDDAFVAYLDKVRSATTVRDIESAVAGPGRPAKGTPNYTIAVEAYQARRAWIEAQTSEDPALKAMLDDRAALITAAGLVR